MAVSMGSKSEVMLDGRTERRLPTGQGVEDIWATIFEYLKEPSDFYRLLLASPQYFEPLLQDRKCSLLFPLVLQVLERRDYIPKTTTLQCRLVSKATKSSIDNCLLDRNPCFENLDDWDHGEFDPCHSPRHCWKTSRMLTIQILTYAEAVRNGRFVPGRSTPFLDGYITIDLSVEVQLQPDILSNFRYLLANYGNQIRHFLPPDLMFPENVYELLREFLSQMPNLRTLQVFSAEERELHPQDLPNLTHLRVLILEAVCHSTQIFTILLSRYGPQLEMLSLKSTFPFDPALINLCGKLRHLVLPDVTCDENVGHYLNPALSWPTSLNTLSITLMDVDSIERISNCLFIALERCFGKSGRLRNLYIKVYGEVSPDEPNLCFPPTARLSLPSLRRLRVSAFGACSPCIDFILGMSQTLEELTMDLSRRGEENRPLATEELPSGRIRWFEQLERMEDSNVWDLMPKLDNITIRRRQYPDYYDESPVPITMRTYRYKRASLGK